MNRIRLTAVVVLLVAVSFVIGRLSVTPHKHKATLLSDQSLEGMVVVINHLIEETKNAQDVQIQGARHILLVIRGSLATNDIQRLVAYTSAYARQALQELQEFKNAHSPNNQHY